MKKKRQRLAKRILDRDDDVNDVDDTADQLWELEEILNCHNDGQHYLVKWHDYDKPTWQPANDLKGAENAIITLLALSCPIGLSHARAGDPPGKIIPAF